MGTMPGNKLLEDLPESADGGLTVTAVRGMDAQYIKPYGGRAKRNHDVLRGGEALYNIFGAHGKLFPLAIAKCARNPNLTPMGRLAGDAP